MQQIAGTFFRPKTSPRQDRAVRTRAELLEATERLVVSQGCEAVTTTRIASATGVAVGTIYRYFPNRAALLLAAYDATVERIVAACTARLEGLAPDLDAEAAITALIDAYLDAAEAIPAHSPLLREMQRLRPVAEDRGRDGERISREILLPFFAHYGLKAEGGEPGRLAVIHAMLSTLVDLYLVTDGEEARTAIRAELLAHALFAFSRLRH